LPPPPPVRRFTVAVTGHRSTHSAFPDDHLSIRADFEEIFAAIDRAAPPASSAAARPGLATTRLHTLFSDGIDQIAANMALDRGWELVSPLPFGRALNAAINAQPLSAGDARAILAGERARDADVRARVAAIDALADRARLFELADQDATITALFLAMLDAPDDFAQAQFFGLESGRRAGLAAHILVEQSDLVIAYWDGLSTANVGGTGHTVATALNLGAPVLWIDPARPRDWRILHAPESLVDCASEATRKQGFSELAEIVRMSIEPLGADPGTIARAAGEGAIIEGPFATEHWRERSDWRYHAYRRVEALFGGGLKRRLGSVVQRYERPDAIARGSGAPILAAVENLPGGDMTLAQRIADEVLFRFAWADGIAAHLSDRYRAGMTVNFVLGSLAITSGVSYLPFFDVEFKWLFASVEITLLAWIILNTVRGQRQRLHGRWFETRRVAEYLRHSPLLLALGVARPVGRWPRGTDTSWPEAYARNALRDVGLPIARVGKAYLAAVLAMLRDHHVAPQRAYHETKASRLERVHAGLDHLAEGLFVAAVVSVATYLVLASLNALGGLDEETLRHAAKYFTVLGVVLPTLGGAIAGIRYFGDFERFAAISEVTAEKLSLIEARIDLLMAAPVDRLEYSSVAELIHATDEVVVEEIENWQSVFSGKRISVPV